jgi:hypothetical protein
LHDSQIFSAVGGGILGTSSDGIKVWQTHQTAEQNTQNLVNFWDKISGVFFF